MRSNLSLSGTWQFQVDPEGTLTVETFQPDRAITVPLPWQAAFPELQQYSGYAWYKRQFTLEKEWLAGELLLAFGAVDYWCRVYVNGKLIGEHEGGYTHFTFPIREYAQEGGNELAVRVYDSAQAHLDIPRWPSHEGGAKAGGPPFIANDVPHGKQEWYINVGGIWQDVTLTAVPLTYLEHIRITPDIHAGSAEIRVTLGGATESIAGGAIEISVVDDRMEGKAWGTTVHLQPGQGIYETTVRVDHPRLWSVETPYLYTARVRLQTSQGNDETSTRFGFREISTHNGQITLNGEPLFLLSALDQDLYPDTIYTVPSEAYLRDQFTKAKELGFNSLRCHIKPPDPIYLDLADELGLLIWAEIPSWRTFHTKGTVHTEDLLLDEALKARVRLTLEDMIKRDFNHPSLVIWTIVNEDWGTALPFQGSDRAWVAEMYNLCKELDPTRLVVDNSPCPQSWGPSIHVQSDLDDFHVYANIPDQARGFEQTIEQFSLRPTWTYSSYGDAQRVGDEPLVLSEFGNWGLPSMRLLTEHHGGEPPWFNIGPWWSPWEGQPGWPAGVEERFRQLGLDSIWGDYEEFAIATQWHQFAAMKFEIEAMRRHGSMAGYVITEFTDAYWESNGLLDFRRNPKAYHDVFAQINAPDVIVPCVDRYAYWDNEAVSVRLHLSHYSAADLEGARLDWRVAGAAAGGEKREGQGHIETGRLARGAVHDYGLHRIALPQVEEARKVRVQFALRNSDGAELAHNILDLLVIPADRRTARLEETVAVIAREHSSYAEGVGVPGLPVDTGMEELGSLQATLMPEGDGQEEPSGLLQRAVWELGYRTTGRLTSHVRMAVSNYPNAELLQWVREGGDLLFLSSGPSPFFWTQSRGGTYSGGWITSFSWLRPEAHGRFQADNPLSMPFMRVMPLTTILGLPVEDPAYQPDFLAGQVSGWVRLPAVHTVQFRYGKGRVIMTTFALEQALTDPIGVSMFHDLIEHLCSPACDPKLVANNGLT